MKKKSSGILVYRMKNDTPEFLLVHPGGPFWKNRDEGAWSVPKGEFTHEDPLQNAIKEFYEETGISISGDFIPLEKIEQKSGKIIFTWMIEKDLNPCFIKSNIVNMEWPKNSGNIIAIPEVDRAAYFSFEDAEKKLIPSQAPLLHQCIRIINKKNDLLF